MTRIWKKKTRNNIISQLDKLGQAKKKVNVYIYFCNLWSAFLKYESSLSLNLYAKIEVFRAHNERRMISPIEGNYYLMESLADDDEEWRSLQYEWIK